MIRIEENQQTFLVGQQLGLYKQANTNHFWPLQHLYPRYLRQQSLVAFKEERGCKHYIYIAGKRTLKYGKEYYKDYAKCL